MIVREIVDLLEKIAPTSYAESWDNVGLLVGDASQPVTSLLLTIDYTTSVAKEAIQLGSTMVVAYHPPIFEGLKKLSSSHKIYDAIRRGIAIYSPHTALDVAEGGTNDVLADMLGIQERIPLRKTRGRDERFKLVTFVPTTHIDIVSEALFRAGAGVIGNYSSCSFRSAGIGTFYGSENSRPAVGSKHQLEHSEEIRVETIVPISCVDRVIQALRTNHPYEEPAFDLLRLAAEPESRGLGRFGIIPPMEREQLFKHIKETLHVDHLLIAGPTTGTVTRAAVGAGACGDLINDALSKKADLYVTGELRHHDALRAAEAGMTTVCALHSNSERIALKQLKQRINKLAPALTIVLSETDCDPFTIL